MTRSKSKHRTRSGSDSKHDRAGLKGNRIRTKKGGGGGNFTWGKPGDEAFIPELKKGDPNYDSQEEDGAAYYSVADANREALNGEALSPSSRHNQQDFSYLNYNGESLRPPKLSLQEFKTEIAKLIREFFVEEDIDEFLQRVQSLDSCMLHYELVKKLISMSMEKSDRERELVSKVFINLQDWKLLPVNQLAKGFERLFEGADDLKLDIPNARKLLAQFLARAVADEVLPPVFLNNKYIQSLAGKIIEHAKVLLSIKHGLVRLERVWGLNMSSSVDDLKKEIKMLLLEYMCSSDCTEAADLLKRLNVPFFHHEVIKRGVILAMERKEREQAMVSVLFKELVTNEVISSRQVILGFQRLYQEIDDIILDNPDAATILDIFANQAVEDNCMSRGDFVGLKKRAKEIAKREKKLLEQELAENGRVRSQSVPN